MLPALAMPAFLKGIPRGVWIALGVVLLIAAFVITLKLYGNARYDAGHADADKEWQEASNRLIEKAQEAGTKADTKAAARAADFAAKQEDEKERIHEALEEGRSPFDELFPANGM